MKKIIIASALLGCVFMLTACGNDKEKDTSDKNVSTTENSSKKYVQPSKIEKENSTDSSNTNSNNGLTLSRKVDWSDDWNGLKTNISEVLLGKPSEKEKDDFNWSGEGAMGIKFTIDNTSNNDMGINMSGAVTAVVNDQQLTPKSMVFTKLAGDDLSGDIFSGVKKEGLLLFDIPELKGNINDINNVRIKWSAENPSGNNESEKYKEYDVMLNLK